MAVSPRRITPVLCPCVVRAWLVAVAAAWLAHTAPALAADPSGPAARILTIEGTVEVGRTNNNLWTRARINQSVALGDRVRTLANSRATVQLADSSVQRLFSLTVLTIEEPNKESREGKPVLRLDQGRLFFKSWARPQQQEFRTPTASGAIRGTEFQLVVENNGRTTIDLVDGEVDLRNVAGAVTLTSGEQGVVDPGQAPRKTPFIKTASLLQWYLYYPGVLALEELELGAAEQTALTASLAAYRRGDLIGALASYPAGRVPATPAERVYHSALLLTVGEVEQASAALTALRATENATRPARLAGALQRLVDAVQLRTDESARSPATLASEHVADSYYWQSQYRLDLALKSAREAVTLGPEFGFAHARVAELEFSFGRLAAASTALDTALRLSPANAQAITLKGFIHAAQNRRGAAWEQFELAIATDGALGNAWLGRGLLAIRSGRVEEGIRDLRVAASLEPNRSLLRSYLGKALAVLGDTARADRELALARLLDAADPTPWLYSALLNQERGRINEAVRDLERSKELNDHRGLYRSRLLLDQDQAVRSANLASIYRDAGLTDLSVREASRAVAMDYGNYSAHIFLANSFDQTRQANAFDLRYETPAYSEYLVARLLGPADGRLLAQPVTQQEYSRLFERDSHSLSTSTEYLSRGAWSQYASQYGTMGNTSYALEGDYRFDPGENPARRSESRLASIKLKQMLSPRSGLYVEALDATWRAGDLRQVYDPSESILGTQVYQEQRPSLILGFDHQWSESHRTLLLASRIDNKLSGDSPHGGTILLTTFLGTIDGFVPTDLTQHYESRLVANSLEVQHIARLDRAQTIAGIRVQETTDRLKNQQVIRSGNAGNGYESYFGNDGDVIIDQSITLRATRLNPYIYQHWQPADSLLLIGGASFAYQEQPRNQHFAPLANVRETHRELSPKAALLWTPQPRTRLQAAYSQSLGGFDLDQSVRLEPAQLVGFVQTHRSLFPESLVGEVGGTRTETIGALFDHQFSTGTYVSVSAEVLRANVDHDTGGFERDVLTGMGPAVQVRELLQYQERSVQLSLNQLVGAGIGLGVRYRIAEANVNRQYPDVDPTLGANDNPISRGVLQQLSLSTTFRHQSGLFGGMEGQWWSQHLSDNLANVSQSGQETFWRANLLAGYRTPQRRAELTLGILNLTDQDYRLSPINLYPDLPRGRTFFTRLQLNF